MGKYPEGSVGVGDLCELVVSVDHWLYTGLTERILPALDEQGLRDHAERMAALAAVWKAQTGSTPGEGPQERGRGWRVWYEDGTISDSLTMAWEDVPEEIVVGISYDGLRRWMVQGRDPYYVKDGRVYDSRVDRWGPSELGPLRKGVYVADEAIREARWQAALSVCLETTGPSKIIKEQLYQGGSHGDGRINEGEDDRTRRGGQVRPHRGGSPHRPDRGRDTGDGHGDHVRGGGPAGLSTEGRD